MVLRAVTDKTEFAEKQNAIDVIDHQIVSASGDFYRRNGLTRCFLGEITERPYPRFFQSYEKLPDEMKFSIKCPGSRVEFFPLSKELVPVENQAVCELFQLLN